jgi:hypothetical protein
MADVKMLGYRNNSACMRESSRAFTQRIICSSLQNVHSAAHTIDELSLEESTLLLATLTPPHSH